MFKKAAVTGEQASITNTVSTVNPVNRINFVSEKFVIDLVCILTVPLLVFFGVKSYLAGLQHYGAGLVLFASLVTASFLLYKRLGLWNLHRNFLLVCYSVIYFYLLVSGGESGTGILWLYAYPLIIFAILGVYIGSLMLAGILTATVCVLLIPDWLGIALAYDFNTKIRFLGSMFFVSIMAYCMERSRVEAAKAHRQVSVTMENLAKTDELTGILNRRGIKECIDLELERTARYKQEMSIVLCDIDYFKIINDEHGHDVGDMVLVNLARDLERMLRSSDRIGRWGGEEFIILLPNTSIERAYGLVERMRQFISDKKVALGDHAIGISMSCGLASTKFSSDLSSLLKAADLSLYEAKEGGRNCTRPVIREAS